MKTTKRLRKLFRIPTASRESHAPRPALAGPRLDFGCGENAKPGFIGVDIRPNPGVEYVCNSWEIVHYVGAASVAEIYSRHFLEHLTFPQARSTLNAWRSILMPKGKLEILVPDIRYHIGQYLDDNPKEPAEANSDWTVREHAVAGFWGWQREADEQLWDVHKSGYDETSLRELLLEFGFDHVTRVSNKPWHLHMTATKPA